MSRDWNKDNTLCEETLMNNLRLSRAVYWLQQYAAEKERADKWKEEAAIQAQLYSESEAREQKLRAAMSWASVEANWGDRENAIAKIVKVINETLEHLYPKEEEAK